MLAGILAGFLWAAETIAVGIALALFSGLSTGETALLAPFVATFLHDAISALLLFLYHGIRGEGKPLLAVCRLPDFKWLALSAAIGGPVGMTGYVMTVHYMGASVGAVASAVYPAIGTLLAFFFLKEKVQWYRWIFLVCTLLGVYGLSYAPGLAVENVWLGLLGAFLCAFGWGTEAVILAKCLKNQDIKSSYALNIRQTVSALIYGGILLPVLGGWDLVPQAFSDGCTDFLPVIALAALFATLSYLFYYRAIAKIGASRAMALNITYTAWAIVFTVVIFRDTSVLNPLTICCSAVVVVCGILAASEPSALLRTRK